MLTELSLIQILSKLNSAIIVSDNNGNFVFWNKRASKIIRLPEEYAPLDKWKYYFNVCNMENKVLEIEEYPLQRSLRGEVIVGQKLILSNVEDNEYIYIDVDSFPVYNKDNKMSGAVVVMSDVGEKVKLQNILKEVSEKLDRIKDHLEMSLSSSNISN